MLELTTKSMANNHSFRGVILNTLEYNRDGSFATQSNRKAILLKVSRDLKACGYDKVTQQNFGPKHCYKLRDYWQKEGLSTATIKNRMACVRWLGTKFGKKLPDNQKLELANRVYSDNTKQKAKEIDLVKYNQLSERHQLSIQLQRQFGLRMEESLKFKVVYADRGDTIQLKASWTKGGRERVIPVKTSEQRKLLNQIKDFCRGKSLIPTENNYIQAKWNFQKAIEKVGIKNVHGYRHQYAQDRYLELTGRHCPKAGGLTSYQLTKEQKQQDYNARMIISNELGHGREEITVQYLGR